MPLETISATLKHTAKTTINIANNKMLLQLMVWTACASVSAANWVASCTTWSMASRCFWKAKLALPNATRADSMSLDLMAPTKSS